MSNSDDPVNDLIKKLCDTPNGPNRRGNVRVGRLLAHCQQVCPDWTEDGGCVLHERDEWIDLMIRPDRDCMHQCLRTLPPLGVMRGVAG